MPNPNASYQEELFREFSQSGAAQKRNLLSKQNLFSAKMISFEQILFAAIGGLITVVVTFSLGVERGKGITRSYETPATEVRVAAPALPVAEKTAAREEKEKVELPAQKNAQKGYTIQVASYKDKKSAERLIGEFRLKGQRSFSLPKGELLIVCVGNYQNPTDASKAAKTLKKQFPDCFVRKL